MRWLPALLILLVQEKFPLGWNPAEDSTLVSKLKFTSRYGDKSITVDSEAEIRVQKTEGEGRAVLIRFNRFQLKESRGKESGSFTFERGKEPVTEGVVDRETAKLGATVAGEVRAIVDSHGDPVGADRQDSFQKIFCFGVIRKVLPPKPAWKGSSWRGSVDVPTADEEFTGEFEVRLTEIVAKKTARMTVAVRQTEPDPNLMSWTWSGKGTMAFSVPDRIVTEYRVSLLYKDEAGKEKGSITQDLTVSVKP